LIKRLSLWHALKDIDQYDFVCELTLCDSLGCRRADVARSDYSYSIHDFHLRAEFMMGALEAPIVWWREPYEVVSATQAGPTDASVSAVYPSGGFMSDGLEGLVPSLRAYPLGQHIEDVQNGQRLSSGDPCIRFTGVETGAQFRQLLATLSVQHPFFVRHVGSVRVSGPLALDSAAYLTQGG
jgi:hypothetical protein